MCYSKDWMANDERRQRESQGEGGGGKASETIKAMLTEAEKQAMHSDSSKAREGAPAK